MGEPPAYEPDEATGRPVTTAGRWASRLRRVTIDVSPLRSSRDFRLLWWSELVSETGHQVTIIAVFIQVYALTKSPAAVGVVGIVQLVPLMLATIGGGPLIDRYDRRTILLVTQCAFAVTSGALLFGATLSRTPLWLIYVPVALAAGLSGVASPTRAAMYPNLVPRDTLPSAIALNQVMWNTTMIVGPAIGGVIVGIKPHGFVWAYLVDVVTYGATIGAALAMSPQPPQRGEEEHSSTLRAIRESIAYLKGRRVLQTTFTVDLIAMIFGMPRALFPILAVTQFHRGTWVVGALTSSIAAGALAGAVTAGWVSRISRQGLAVLVAVAIWGAGIAAFGLAGNRLAIAFALLAAAGAADVISAVFRGTILQLTVPDSIRGRMNAVHILVVTGGPRLGDFEAGLVAQWFGATTSVVSGGLACVVGVVALSALVPQFAAYRTGAPPA